MFKKILVATDFDDPSKDALTTGVALAREHAAELHIVHVMMNPLTQPWGADAYGIDLPKLLGEMRVDASRALDVLVSEARAAISDVHAEVLVGSPAVEIVRYATAQTIDLIIVGSHGRGPVPRALLGSVADRVLREAPCPVLTVRHKVAGKGGANSAE